MATASSDPALSSNSVSDLDTFEDEVRVRARMFIIYSCIVVSSRKIGGIFENIARLRDRRKVCVSCRVLVGKTLEIRDFDKYSRTSVSIEIEKHCQLAFNF